VVGDNPASNSAIFAPDLLSLPVSNIGIARLNIEGIAFGGVGTNPHGIRLSTNVDGDANSIENIKIRNVRFKNLGSGVYILQRTTAGTSTRQVKNVRIKDCIADGCVGSFVTADGEDIIIRDCIADGIDVAQSYDAVSIHSGINVKVLSNTFKNYGLGQVVNIRNSPENHCGSENVKVRDNAFVDCPTTATQVSIQSGEVLYGVTDVLIMGNTYKNVKNATLVTSGNATSGTPLKSIDIKHNKFKNITNEGISVRCNSAIWLEDSEILGNTGTVTATTTGFGMYIEYIRRSVVNSNKIYSTANQVGHKSLYINNLYYSVFEDNHVWVNDATQTIMTVTNMLESSFIGNYIRGVYSFATLTNCTIKANNFRNNGTNEGRTFSNGWEQLNSNVTIYSNAAPTALTWNKGDKVINNSPTPGSYEGWICTSTGTPGTWNGYGLIAA
jgi:hypothetical protein